VLRAAVYLRVSTNDQDEQNQEAQCLELCRGRGWEPIVVREKASGRKDDRPGWLEVLELARLGRVQAVVFWSLSRTGRRRVQIAHDMEELMRWQVAIACVRQRFFDAPADGPMRSMLVQMFAWFAQEELEEIGARTRVAMARLRELGLPNGRPRKVTPTVTARALELRRLGHTWGTIARQLEAEGLGRFTRGALSRNVGRVSGSGDARAEAVRKQESGGTER
jgi:DNA invertase Pin-like site-specific DNA recombinase